MILKTIAYLSVTFAFIGGTVLLIPSSAEAGWVTDIVRRKKNGPCPLSYRPYGPNTCIKYICCNGGARTCGFVYKSCSEKAFP